MTTAGRPTWAAAMGGNSLRDRGIKLGTVSSKDLKHETKMKTRTDLVARKDTGEDGDADGYDSHEDSEYYYITDEEDASDAEGELAENVSMNNSTGEASVTVSTTTVRVKRRIKVAKSDVRSLQRQIKRARKGKGVLELGEEQDVDLGIAIRRNKRSKMDDGEDVENGVKTDEHNEEEHAALSNAESISGEDSESDSSDDDDDEGDEELQLMKELEKVREERRLAREAQELRARQDEERAAVGNPLLATGTEHEKTSVDSEPSSQYLPQLQEQELLQSQQQPKKKRRWNDDIVFKNQAPRDDSKGTQKRVVNYIVRSDTCKDFLKKYVK